MNAFHPEHWRCLLLVAGLGFASCTHAPSPQAAAPPSAAALTAIPGQSFAQPDDAIAALKTATQAKDFTGLRNIFGPGLDNLLSGDTTQDAVECGDFAKNLTQRCNPVTISDGKIVLYIGEENWPFPIPLVQAGGAWHFDTAAGAQEVLNRRIGKDELTALSVCRAYVAAQRDYASEDHDGDGILQYASRLNSTLGHHDGLFWPPVEGEELSPLGPLVADANDEGYAADKPIGRSVPFHGYFFKILQGQGPAAPGGQFNYIINGRMIAGFALVAYPAHWGDSGIMTFIVNQEGKIYQRNLGPDSAQLAHDLTVFNPDATWSVADGDGSAPP